MLARLAPIAHDGPRRLCKHGLLNRNDLVRLVSLHELAQLLDASWLGGLARPVVVVVALNLDESTRALDARNLLVFRKLCELAESTSN